MRGKIDRGLPSKLPSRIYLDKITILINIGTLFSAKLKFCKKRIYIFYTILNINYNDYKQYLYRRGNLHWIG